MPSSGVGSWVDGTWPASASRLNIPLVLVTTLLCCTFSGPLQNERRLWSSCPRLNHRHWWSSTCPSLLYIREAALFWPEFANPTWHTCWTQKSSRWKAKIGQGLNHFFSQSEGLGFSLGFSGSKLGQFSCLTLNWSNLEEVSVRLLSYACELGLMFTLEKNWTGTS